MHFQQEENKTAVRKDLPIFFSLLRKAVINAPLTVLLPVWMGTDGVFVAEAVSQLVGGNFPNPSFFSKFFKRMTGMTPHEYQQTK